MSTNKTISILNNTVTRVDILNILILGIVIFLSSCTSSGKSENDPNQKIKVVATTGMLYDAARVIGGEKIEPVAIMGPGVDPHLYKATQGDLQKLRSGDLIIYNGLMLEGKMGEILERLSSNKNILAAAESIPDSLLNTSQVYDNAYDPHVWFDVKLWKRVVKSITVSLAETDSLNAEYYHQNATQYLNTLDTLDQYVTENINTIPESQRVLVTAHDAFGYFGEAYDMDVVGLQGISTVSDFGLRDIADLTDLIIEREVKAIFVETSVSDKAIKSRIFNYSIRFNEFVITSTLCLTIPT
jgi:manganese/zinc/iron transport system substrate-binding protein